ncbi:MAG: hypothetical protein OXG62_07910 [Nitrospinae bacterium]|nr:hypothetical protein [Nitrospinota bacterium]
MEFENASAGYFAFDEGGIPAGEGSRGPKDEVSFIERICEFGPGAVFAFSMGVIVLRPVHVAGFAEQPIEGGIV